MIQQKRFLPLTSLRFFAAFLVLLHHVVPAFASDWPAAWPNFLRKVIAGGEIGVPFFFVLSGFVLAHSEARLSIRSFWWRRFTKMAPLFYLSLCLHLPAVLLQLNSSAVVMGVSESGKILLGNFLFLGAWYPKLLILNPPGWTLSAEAFFYLTFPWILTILAKIPHRMLFWALTANFVLGGSFHLIGFLWAGEGSSALIFDFFHSNPLVHINEFIAGILLARLYHARSDSRLPAPALLFCLGSLGAAAMLACSDWVSPLMLKSFIGVPCFCLMIWGACGLDRSWLSRRVWVALGECSFALYVIQWPLIDWLMLANSRLPPPSALRSGALILGCLVLFPALSLILYRVVEVPLRQRLLGLWA